MFLSWLAALALGVTSANDPASRLADIRPAPRTVLVDCMHAAFDLEKLRGKVVLVSFVYTTCNGVCPLTTQALTRRAEAARGLQALGEVGRVRFHHA